MVGLTQWVVWRYRSILRTSEGSEGQGLLGTGEELLFDTRREVVMIGVPMRLVSMDE